MSEDPYAPTGVISESAKQLLLKQIRSVLQKVPSRTVEAVLEAIGTTLASIDQQAHARGRQQVMNELGLAWCAKCGKAYRALGGTPSGKPVAYIHLTFSDHVPEVQSHE